MTKSNIEQRKGLFGVYLAYNFRLPATVLGMSRQELEQLVASHQQSRGAQMHAALHLAFASLILFRNFCLEDALAHNGLGLSTSLTIKTIFYRHAHRQIRTK